MICCGGLKTFALRRRDWCTVSLVCEGDPPCWSEDSGAVLANEYAVVEFPWHPLIRDAALASGYVVSEYVAPCITRLLRLTREMCWHPLSGIGCFWASVFIATLNVRDGERSTVVMGVMSKLPSGSRLYWYISGGMGNAFVLEALASDIHLASSGVGMHFGIVCVKTCIAYCEGEGAAV